MKMWKITYYDSYGDKVCVVILARTQKIAFNKFLRDFGYYTIESIKEII